MKNKIYQILTFCVALSIIVSIYMVFCYAPIEKNMGFVQKIFYFHLPVAIIPYLAFLVTLIFSLVYLVKRERKWDMVAHASAEIGLVIDTLVLITGPLWAKPVWGHWWVWEPRLTTSFIMWLLYVGYLMLRHSVPEENRRARFSAVYGIVAFVSVPISFMSIRWWRTVHPLVIKGASIELEPPMVLTMLVSLFSFVLFYYLLLSQRVRLENLKDEVEVIKDEVEKV